jgi:hypothetical protein
MQRKPGKIFKSLQRPHPSQLTAERDYPLQLCFPVPAPDWYVLFAIQQWNIQTNNVVRALSYGVNFIQGKQNTINTLSYAFKLFAFCKN